MTNVVSKWSKSKAFEQMDWLAKGYISGVELEQAIEKLADPMLRRDKNDIECLVRRFNKDKSTGKVSIKEFIDELLPKVPLKKL